MTAKEKISVTSAVKKVIDALPDGYEFSGYDLRKMCSRIAPALSRKYVETFLRILRATRRECVVCVSRSKSLYRKVA